MSKSILSFDCKFTGESEFVSTAQAQKDTKKTGVMMAQSDVDTIDDLDAFCKSSAVAIQRAHDAGSDMQKALVMARSVLGIKQRLTDKVMADVMALQGTPIGFKTDKDRSGGYPVEVVREVLTLVLISGLRVCGNEFNIIAGNMYATKDGLKRRISQFDGLTDLEVKMGVPLKISDTVAVVPCSASWRLHSSPRSIDCLKTDDMDGRIPVKFDQYSSVDAILGKAISKLYRRIYERLTGSAISTTDDSESFGTIGDSQMVLLEANEPQSKPVHQDNAKLLAVEDDAVKPEALPGDFELGLSVAMKGCASDEHIENARSFWTQKAINRGLTAGQKETMHLMFDAAHESLKAT
jgi:hypothetical protein